MPTSMAPTTRTSLLRGPRTELTPVPCGRAGESGASDLSGSAGPALVVPGGCWKAGCCAVAGSVEGRCVGVRCADISVGPPVSGWS